MIKVYEATETQFANNGIKIIKPSRAQVFKEDNGEYYLELEASTSYIEWLQQNNIVRVNTPWGEQGFRLNNPEISKDRLAFKAKHLFYDSERYLLTDAYPQNLNCADGLNWILERTVPENNFTAISDLTELKSARYVRRSLLESVLSHLELYGGHLYRNNLEIGIKSQIGADRGVTVQYGKNIEDLKAYEDWDSVVTKILPVGYNGVMLPEEFLTADIQYSIPYVKSVSFNPSENINTENILDVIEDLRTQAQAYLDVNKYPKVSYELKAHLDGIVDIGDTIKVIHSKMGIDLFTDVISLKYDCLTEKFNLIQFGNFRKTLKSIIKRLDANETAIDARVEKGKIIASINVSEENIVISGNRIDLRGLVTITGLASGETEIDGGAIKANSIEVDSIKVQDLKVKRIFGNNNGFLTVNDSSSDNNVNTKLYHKDGQEALSITAIKSLGDMMQCDVFNGRNMFICSYDNGVFAMTMVPIMEFLNTVYFSGNVDFSNATNITGLYSRFI
jgi:phage minor structural protein